MPMMPLRLISRDIVHNAANSLSQAASVPEAELGRNLVRTPTVLKRMYRQTQRLRRAYGFEMERRKGI